MSVTPPQWVKAHTQSDREKLMEFVDWYDPEAKHSDLGLEGIVDEFLKGRQ